VLRIPTNGAHKMGRKPTRLRASAISRWSPQFITALGEPDARSGSGAQSWGVWRQDPGPRGVWLDNYAQLQAEGGVATVPFRALYTGNK